MKENHDESAWCLTVVLDCNNSVMMLHCYIAMSFASISIDQKTGPNQGGAQTQDSAQKKFRALMRSSGVKSGADRTARIIYIYLSYWF